MLVLIYIILNIKYNDASIKVKHYKIEDSYYYAIPGTDIGLWDDIISYYAYGIIDDMYLAFMSGSFDSYQDPNNPDNWISSRKVYVLYFDPSYQKFMPYKKTNKYTVSVDVYYIKNKT